MNFYIIYTSFVPSFARVAFLGALIIAHREQCPVGLITHGTNTTRMNAPGMNAPGMKSLEMNRPRIKPSRDECTVGSRPYWINVPWDQCHAGSMPLRRITLVSHFLG